MQFGRIWNRLFTCFIQIVALPYNTLLHKSTREASSIQLKDNIVVIDEAHNLLETINSVYSVEITGAQVIFDSLFSCSAETKFESDYLSLYLVILSFNFLKTLRKGLILSQTSPGFYVSVAQVC